ncbi:MAG: Brp/Blh family beta-carotene 15,15'-monooxygenase, partial [Paracoccaceae bacterium]
MIASPRWQTVLFGAVSVLTLGFQVTVQPDLILQLLLLAPLVAILGLPHGALDLPIAEAVWPLDGLRGKLRFVVIYLGLAACVIVA